VGAQGGTAFRVAKADRRRFQKRHDDHAFAVAFLHRTALLYLRLNIGLREINFPFQEAGAPRETAGQQGQCG
jgi:hypothetical protein